MSFNSFKIQIAYLHIFLIFQQTFFYKKKYIAIKKLVESIEKMDRVYVTKFVYYLYIER